MRTKPARCIGKPYYVGPFLSKDFFSRLCFRAFFCISIFPTRRTFCLNFDIFFRPIICISLFSIFFPKIGMRSLSERCFLFFLFFLFFLEEKRGKIGKKLLDKNGPFLVYSRRFWRQPSRDHENTRQISMDKRVRHEIRTDLAG